MIDLSIEKTVIKFEFEQVFGGEKNIEDLIHIDQTAYQKLVEENKSKIYLPSTVKEDWLADFQNDCTVFFILVNGKRVGSLSFKEKENFTEFYVSGVAMLPEYQGLGIVKRALQSKIIEAKNSGKYKRIYLVTHPENPAKKLYESIGFFDTGNIVENYDNSGEPRIIMNLK